ncbi:MAG TPA: hypothetical protein VIA45_13330 [Thermoanaerobaculia bacterium]
MKLSRRDRTFSSNCRGPQGQPDLLLDRPHRIGRQHADDTERHAAYPQIAIEHVGNTARRALPQAIADDGHARALQILIGRLEGPADQGANTQDVEERLTNLRGLDALEHRRAACDVDRSRLPYRDVGEDVALFAPVEVIGVRDAGALESARRVRRDRHDQRVGIGVRERRKEHRRHRAENRDRRADAERERHQCHQRVGVRFEQDTCGEAKALDRDAF